MELKELVADDVMAGMTRDRSQPSVYTFREMTSDEIRRPPTPVIAVIALTALPAVSVLVITMIVVFAEGDPAGALFVLLALLPGAAAFGLWQGNRGARVVAIMIGAAAFPASNAPGVYGLALIVYGLTIILLLVAPRSSRAWFTRHRCPKEQAKGSRVVRCRAGPAPNRRL
ncbi:hypothetical protein [Streptomyces sp. NPDC002845]